MDQATLDALFKKGAISQDTYDLGTAKFGAPEPNASTLPDPSAPPELPAAVPDPEPSPAPGPAAPAPGEPAPAPSQPGIASAAASGTPAPGQGIVPASAAQSAVGAPPAPGANPIKLASDAMPTDPGTGMPGAIANLGKAYELQQQGVAQEAQAGAKQAQREAGYLDEAQKQLQRQQDAALVAEHDRKKALDDQMKKIQSAADEASKTASIDPDRFYKNMSTGTKIGFAVSAFLSAFAGNGGNAAIEMLQKSVDRDIDAQKQDFERAKGKVGLQQSIFGDMMQKFGDERQADAASRLAILNHVELQLKQAAAQYKSPQVQARAVQGMAVIEQQKQGLMVQAQQAYEVQQAKQRLSGASAGANPSVDLERIPEKDRERYVNVGGVSGFATSPDRAKAFSQFAQDVTGAKQNIQELMKIDRSLPFTEDRARANLLQQALIGQLRTAILGPGTINDSERKIMTDILANPSQIFTSQAKTKLAELEKILDKKFAAGAQSEGLRPLKVSAAR